MDSGQKIWAILIIVFVIGIYLVLCLAVGGEARRRGHSRLAFSLLSVLLTPVGAFIILVLVDAMLGRQ